MCGCCSSAIHLFRSALTDRSSPPYVYCSSWLRVLASHHFFICSSNLSFFFTISWISQLVYFLNIFSWWWWWPIGFFGNIFSWWWWWLVIFSWWWWWLIGFFGNIFSWWWWWLVIFSWWWWWLIGFFGNIFSWWWWWLVIFFIYLSIAAC